MKKAFNIRISAQKKYSDALTEQENERYKNQLQNTGATSVEADLIIQGNKIKLQSTTQTDKQLEDAEFTHQQKLISINKESAATIVQLTKQEKEQQLQSVHELNTTYEQAFSTGISGTQKNIATEFFK